MRLTVFPSLFHLMPLRESSSSGIIEFRNQRAKVYRREFSTSDGPLGVDDANEN